MELKSIELIRGNGSRDFLWGNDDANVIAGSGGHDILYGEGGDDVFLHNAWDYRADHISGGDGFDTWLGTDQDDVMALQTFQGDMRVERIDGGGGYNTLYDDWYGQMDLRGIELRNIHEIRGGRHQDNIHGNDDANLIRGWQGHDKLYGEGGDDEIVGGEGGDRVEGGEGSDLYHFDHGDGYDLLVETTSPTDQDTLRFGTGIAAEDLWLYREGNDLHIDLIESAIETDDGVRIQDWYATGQEARVERIETADQVLFEADVQRLVEAMAGFGVEGGSEYQLSQSQRGQLAPTLAAVWQDMG